MNKKKLRLGFLYATAYGALAQFNSIAANIVFYFAIAGAVVLVVMGTKVSEMAGAAFGNEHDKLTGKSIAASIIVMIAGLVIGHVAMAAVLAVLK